jgi:hypothetical protein
MKKTRLDAQISHQGLHDGFEMRIQQLGLFLIFLQLHQETRRYDTTDLPLLFVCNAWMHVLTIAHSLSCVLSSC